MLTVQIMCPCMETAVCQLCHGISSYARTLNSVRQCMSQSDHGHRLRTLSVVLCRANSWGAPRKKRQPRSPSIFSHSSSKLGDVDTGCTQ